MMVIPSPSTVASKVSSVSVMVAMVCFRSFFIR